MKIGVAIPVYGRSDLVVHTIKRLEKQTLKPCKIVAVCSCPEDIEAVRHLDIDIVGFFNYPLGAKWQKGVDKLNELCDNMDGFLYLGSSDWLSHNWIEIVSKYLNKYDLVGKLDCYFLDIGKENNKRLIHWSGYTNERVGEAIGIGRMISKRILDKVSWQLFPKTMNGSLDWHQIGCVKENGGSILNLNRSDIVSLSISTYKWENKHKFDQEARDSSSVNVGDVDGFLNKHKFTEALNLFGE